MNKSFLASVCSAAVLAGLTPTTATAQTPPTPTATTAVDDCEAILTGGEWKPDFEAPDLTSPASATPTTGTGTTVGQNSTAPTANAGSGTTAQTPASTPAVATARSGVYVTNPNPNATAKGSKQSNGVVYYHGTYVSGSQRQNLAQVKSYVGPTSGTILTIGGQKIQASSSRVNVAGLHSSMVNIIDELHLTAAALGMPKPVITSATEGTHSAKSLHPKGKALDIRCQAATPCKKWAMTLKNALGAGYDVFWEDWTGSASPGNSHIHIEYDGSA